jgi:outer membrane protein TolC
MTRTLRGGALWLLLLAALPRPGVGQVLTLQTALDSALATHPTVRSAEARVAGADAMRTAARSAFLPSVAGTTGLTRFAEPMVVAPLHGFDPTHPPDFDRTLVQSQLGMEMTLFDGGGRRAAVRGAEAAEDGLGLSRDATVQDLLEAVTGAYTGLLAGRELRNAARRLVEALSSELDRAQQRLREGTAARVEVLRAEAALLDARAQLATADARVTLSERGLARMMGADPASLLERPLAGVAPRPDGASTDGPRPDPRLEAARRNVDVARARLSQERAGWLPTVKATAALQNFGSGLGEYVTEWQAGVRLTWPLFTGGARRASIQRAAAEMRVAEEGLRLAELAVAGGRDAADAALAEASSRAAALAASVDQWEEVTRIEALSLETGSGVQQDYLRAEAALYQARAGHARARYDEILARVGQARAQGRLDREWMNDALEMRR